jgi:hypothetical protein
LSRRAVGQPDQYQLFVVHRGIFRSFLLGPVSEPQNQNRRGRFVGVEDGTAEVPS